MKRGIQILILLSVCTLLGLWSPWLSWRLDVAGFFGVETPDSIAGLEVYSLSGDLDVYIEGELQGTATEEAPVFLDSLDPGTKSVRLERQTEVEGSYWTFNKLVDFSENITVVISYALGPEEEFTEGHVITAKKMNNIDDDNLVINTNITDFTLDVNGVSAAVQGDRHTIKIPFDDQIVLKLSKPGYEVSEFTILPDDRDERTKLEGYEINVDVHMLLQPVIVD